MKFKVGDWIRSKDGTDISRVGVDTIKWYKEIECKDIMDEWELWHPEKDEWCWNTKTKSLGYIKQIVDTNLGRDYYFYSRLNGVDSYGAYSIECFEPFIGELPLFIKDNL